MVTDYRRALKLYVYMFLTAGMARDDATQRMVGGWSWSLDGDMVVHRGHPGGSNSVYPVSKLSTFTSDASQGGRSESYAHPTIFLFLGAFLLALSVEKWALHRRIALNVLVRTGTDGRKLILGFMVAGALLSMWMTNTSTAMMLLPIATSVAAMVVEKVERCQ